MMSVLRAAIFAMLAGCFAEPPGPVASTSGDASTGTPSTSSMSSTTQSSTSTSSTTESTSTTTSEASTSSEGGSSSSTGTPSMCGDLVVDDDEMCDGGPGCLDCAFTDYACNPLNNAPCEEGLRCGLVDVFLETFSCMPPGAGDIGEDCGEPEINDAECQSGLTCLYHPQTPLCDAGNCCVRYCSIAELDSGCAPDEDCLLFFPEPMFDGLEHLGFCGAPA